MALDEKKGIWKNARGKGRRTPPKGGSWIWTRMVRCWPCWATVRAAAIC